MKLDTLDHPALSEDDYDARLPELQSQLSRLQLALYRSARRAVIVVEGTDASGKGGFIRRLIWTMDPRGVWVHPIGAPTPDELTEHYLQRFWRRLPSQGQLTIFDRSWYGRVLIERVEGLTPNKTWKRAYREIKEFERLLTDDGVTLIKLFLTIGEDEQISRFRSRFENPDKRWKLTEADMISREFWQDYQAAYEDMLDKTSSKSAPWQVIPANDKRYARIAAMTHVRDELAKVVDPHALEIMSPELEERINAALYD